MVEIGVFGTLMALCIAFGGASRAGFAANALVQIACLAAIAWGIASDGPRRLSTDERRLWNLAFGLIALFLLQLLPLPHGVWSALPGRAPIAEGLRLAGLDDPAMPLSLASEYTLRSLLGVLPALAFIMVTARAGRTTADGVVAATLAMAVLSALIGLAQVGSGSSAFTYFYDITNRGDAVGFFANANHLATLMVVSIPLATGLVAAYAARRKASRAAQFAFVLLVPLIVVAAATILMTHSIAGVGLMAVALLGSVPIAFADFFGRRRWSVVVGLLVAALIVAAAVAGMTLFGQDNADGMSRGYMWRTTLAAGRSVFPAGSGFGSFEQVFHLFEDRGAIRPTYANHAHNDLLEFVLEGGLPGLLLVSLFLVWFLHRCWSAWLDGSRRDPLAQAGSLVILLILMHSLVDYPIRTAAIAAIFGLSCALLARPPRSAWLQLPAPEAEPTARHLSA